MNSIVAAALICGSAINYGHDKHKEARGMELCRAAFADCFKWQKDKKCLDLDKYQFMNKTGRKKGFSKWPMRSIIHSITDCQLYKPMEFGPCNKPESYYFWRENE